ncbi:MAG: hypothetical protein WA865_09860 [Spirulinaceae cyanobacterium]
MLSSSVASSDSFSQDSEVWENLKQAIANSSGFKRWRTEQLVNNQELEKESLDVQVRSYLRETLETLAY